MQNVVAHTLSLVTPGPPSTFENLTMFPLVGPPSIESDPFYLTLDQALGDGWTEITEISEQGSVPRVARRQQGGEARAHSRWRGARRRQQNRVVNLTILVPAHADLAIPVSCAEAGRWRARSRAFSAAPRTQYAAGRVKRMAQVTASMQMSGDHRSDQSGCGLISRRSPRA